MPGLAAALGVALALPAGASAVTLGSTHLGKPSEGSRYCGGNPSCSSTQTKLPGAIVKAPARGHIKRWRVNVVVPGKLQLLVLERVAEDQFKALAASEKRSPATAGVKKFKTNLSIDKKNFIGISLLDATVNIGGYEKLGAEKQGFLPAFTVGNTLTSSPGYSDPDDVLQFNATLEG
jgi:hypothetical protein